MSAENSYVKQNQKALLFILDELEKSDFMDLFVNYGN